MDGVGAAVKLRYLTPGEADGGIDGRALGLIAFGGRVPPAAPADLPCVSVDMPVLGGTAVLEVWLSEQPVVRETAGGIRSARNEAVMFGCIELPLDRPIDETCQEAYCRIFDFMDARGYGELLRVWNYFPGINEEDSGLERYRRFSVGRHDAFAVKRRSVGTGAPAACALGSRSGALAVCFLAAREAGTAVENPRQMSAFRYPPQYGPRAPVFSRAMLCRPGGWPALFISGTASIVGHETAHAGDAGAQAAETARNVLAVIEEARRAGFAPGHAPLQLKAYVRRPDDLPAVRERLEQAFGAAELVYLQADVCRAELLVEVEGVCIAKPN